MMAVNRLEHADLDEILIPFQFNARVEHLCNSRIVRREGVTYMHLLNRGRPDTT